MTEADWLLPPEDEPPDPGGAEWPPNDDWPAHDDRPDHDRPDHDRPDHDRPGDDTGASDATGLPEPPPGADAAAPEPPAAAVAPIGADPDRTDGFDDGTAADFPPPVPVGDLPEPVDGFPWIDTGLLGEPDAGPADQPGGVDVAELAGYAAAEVPDDDRGWAALAASDDPAVAALARWWAPPAGG